MASRFEHMNREQLEAILNDYEVRLDWHSTCRGCAEHLDKSFEAYQSELVEAARLQSRDATEAMALSEEKVKLWQEYYQLLKTEFESLVGIAWVHGWRPNLTGRQMHRAEELRRLLGVE